MIQMARIQVHEAARVAYIEHEETNGHHKLVKTISCRL
jgi:hypothetical protein